MTQYCLRDEAIQSDPLALGMKQEIRVAYIMPHEIMPHEYLPCLLTHHTPSHHLPPSQGRVPSSPHPLHWLIGRVFLAAPSPYSLLLSPIPSPLAFLSPFSSALPLPCPLTPLHSSVPLTWVRKYSISNIRSDLSRAWLDCRSNQYKEVRLRWKAETQLKREYYCT